MDKPAILAAPTEDTALTALLLATAGCTTPLWGDERYAATLSQLKDSEVNVLVQALAKSRQLDVEGVREILAVFGAGPYLDRGATLQALSERLQADAPLIPPLAVLRGTLSPLCDLAAQLATAADVAEALLPTNDGVKAAAQLARSAQAAAQDARIFGATSRTLQSAIAASGSDAALAEKQTTWLMHQKRLYQTCKVFGVEHIKLQLELPNTSLPFICYLDDAHKNELPLLAQFEATLLAEVHPVQDGDTVGDGCLRIVALGREVVAERWLEGQWELGG